MKDKERERELAIVTSFIISDRLFKGTEFEGSFWSEVEHAFRIAEAFVEVYPNSHPWEDADEFENTLYYFVKNNLK